MRKKLLLHSCCAPCSSSVIEQLMDTYDISVLYYNPCIYPLEEYEKRKAEQIRLLKIRNIPLIDCKYENEKYEQNIKGFEDQPEGSKRCEICFNLRLEETAKIAKKQNFDIFGTTLTVSPHKNCLLINQIGDKLSKKYEIEFLDADFKKKNGYLRSIQISKELELYRQNYCGCKYSMRKEINE